MDIIESTAVITKCSRKTRLKKIGKLCRSGMEDGNAGEFKRAEEKLTIALKEVKDSGNYLLEAKILNNLGIIFTLNGIWDRAFIRFNEALVLTIISRGEDNVLYRTIQKNMMQAIQEGS